MKTFDRQEIRSSLRGRIARREPIILAGAGSGLVSKAAEDSGIDLIMAYSTGPFRINGHGASAGHLAYTDANTAGFSLIRKCVAAVQHTPVITGIGAGDPFRNIDQLIDDVINAGASGVTNVPTAGGHSGKMRRRIDAYGFGFPKEIELIGLCNAKDVFSVAYGYNKREVREMVANGVDVVGVHVGTTTGGLVGSPEKESLSEACDRTQALYEVAVSENPDVIVVSHGGPFEDAETVRACFEQTDVHGFIGASAIERIPLEKRIADEVASFRAISIAGASDRKAVQ